MPGFISLPRTTIRGHPVPTWIPVAAPDVINPGFAGMTKFNMFSCWFNPCETPDFDRTGDME
jgi:hypothetical protein